MDDIRIYNVWEWCFNAYIRNGRKLNFPANTDPKKTYQWRYLTAIAKKFEEWGLTDDAAQKFIDIAVETAKEHNMLQKGLAVLHQGNMLDICYDKLTAQLSRSTDAVESLKQTHDWLHSKIGDEDIVKTLLSRPRRNAFCNLTIWSQSSKLSPLYLALSKPCTLALMKLETEAPDERNLLPASTRLYSLRSSFLSDNKNKDRIKEALAPWRKPCLQS